MKAKALLQSIDVPYEEIDVAASPDVRAEMSEKYNWMTVPMITIGDEFVGGYDDLAKLHAKGELVKKLEE